jgi:hypothetical protein
MALDILSIPAMSAAPERLFSGAKITLTDRRNRLGIGSINALMCLQSWYKILDMEDTILDLEAVLKEESGLDTRLIQEVEALELTLGAPQLD